MNIDWNKWLDLEAEHKRLEAGQEFARERLDDATLDLRNVEASLLRSAAGFGVFRRFAAGDWLRDIKANPEAALARHAEHPISAILGQFVRAQDAHHRAAERHQRAERSYALHSQSFFRIRDWIRDQQSRGLI